MEASKRERERKEKAESRQEEDDNRDVARKKEQEVHVNGR